MAVTDAIRLYYQGVNPESYTVVGPVKARVTSGQFAWAKRERSTADVDSRLCEEALRMGANAVIDVTYKRGWSWSSYKALTATGTAVRVP